MILDHESWINPHNYVIDFNIPTSRYILKSFLFILLKELDELEAPTRRRSIHPSSAAFLEPDRPRSLLTPQGTFVLQLNHSLDSIVIFQGHRYILSPSSFIDPITDFRGYPCGRLAIFLIFRLEFSVHKVNNCFWLFIS